MKKIRIASGCVAAAFALLSPLAHAEVDGSATFRELVEAGAGAAVRHQTRLGTLEALVPVGAAVAQSAGFVKTAAAADYLSSSSSPSFSASAGPDPSVAWLMALGFLGLVILRRTR